MIRNDQVRESGYPTDVSFDTVWAEACRKADEAEAAREKIAALKIDPMSSEGRVWNTALDRAIAILSGTDKTDEMSEKDEQGS